MFRHRELRTHKQHVFGDLFDNRFVVNIIGDFVYELRDLPGLLFFHTACGYRRRSESQSAWICRRGRVVGNGVVVGFDSGPVQRLGELFAGDIFKVGPEGLGFLRAAPATGAICMALFLAYNPPLKKAGRNLFIGVFGFGVLRYRNGRRD